MSITSEKVMRSKARKALWLAIIAIITWLAVGGFSGQVFPKISNVQENDNSAFLPESAESTAASKIIVKFSDQSLDLLPTLLIVVGDIDPVANPEKFAQVSEFARSLGQRILPESNKPLSSYFAAGAPIQAIPSQDGKAALINVQIDSVIAGENINDEPALPLIVEFIREEMKRELAGFETHVTGPGGIFADLFDAFGSIDTTLLRTTLIVVAIILILVYR
ncbi:MAG: MMPL family transporter, partial [Actinobacteria bacterium]|nr:MMPL family transporter [Actinomycetota bacterium]